MHKLGSVGSIRLNLARTIALIICAMPGHAAAQARPDFIREIIEPLIVETLDINNRSDKWRGERAASMAGKPRCHDIAAEYDGYKLRKYTLPTEVEGERRTELVQAVFGANVDQIAGNVRLLINRCKEESASFCNSSGNARAVSEAVRSMAVLRLIFYMFDKNRGSGPVLTESFRQPTGDDDLTWMKDTIQACGRYTLNWRVNHAHECVYVTPAWKFDITAAIPVTAVAPNFELKDDVPSGEIAYHAGPTAAKLVATAPGKQKEGITLGYRSASFMKPVSARVQSIDFQGDGRPHRFKLQFLLSNIEENAFVTVPGVLTKNMRYDHWLEGYASLFGSAAKGDVLELDQFQSSQYPLMFVLEKEGKGPPLRDTEGGCIPGGKSRFELVHIRN